jgi:hypothetical protein
MSIKLTLKYTSNYETLSKHNELLRTLASKAYKEPLQLFTKICTNSAEPEKVAKNQVPYPDTTTTQGIVNHQLIA